MIDLLNHYHILFETPLFWLYIGALIVDIISGNIKAWTTNTLDSSVGIKGTLKHFALLAFVMIFLPTLSVYMGDRTIAQGVMLYFVYQYIISIIENMGTLGFTFPDNFAKHFKRLDNGTDQERDDF